MLPANPSARLYAHGRDNPLNKREILNARAPATHATPRAEAGRESLTPHFLRGSFAENLGPGSAMMVDMLDDRHRQVMAITTVVAIIVIVVIAGVWIIR
jgi:hypothetical protein